MTWRRHELQGMDRKTRKLLTMYGAFHPKSDVDRLYLPRAMGGRGLISWEGCVTSKCSRISEDMLMLGEVFVEIEDWTTLKDFYRMMQIGRDTMTCLKY